MINKLHARPTTRREFMIQAAAAGATGLVAPTFGGTPALAAPSRGGTLKVGIGTGATTDDFSPLTTGHPFLYAARWTAYNNLIELDPNKNPVPELAESWEVNAGATEWVFNLRKGVEFSNGKTLDANDVIYSINLHRSKDTKSSSKPLLSEVETIEAVTPNQVRFRLSQGQSELLQRLADFGLYIVPDGYNDWSKAVGTGGYRLENWEPGVRAAFTRNENYWKPERAWVDSVELLSITDSAARNSALTTGTTHVAHRIEPKVAKFLSANPDIELVSTPAQNYFNTLMWCREGPFQNVDVRLAFKHLLPREAIVTKLLSGFGEVGNDHPVPSADPYFHTELPKRPYDPERAKFHLKKAGHDSFSIDLHASTAAHPEAINAAVLIQDAAKAAGVEINVVRAAADAYWSATWMKVPFCISIWGLRPTPAMQMDLGYRSDAKWNDTAFSSERFDGLLAQAKVTTDFDRRRQIYWDLQEILHNEGGAGIFAFMDVLDAYSKKVKGTVPDSVRELMGCRISERVWLES
ncbi:MAG: peptide ABC transporter substrate-binding protein [Rhizobiales bacterium]|nr:peptide ABC transporter substrate-binding protein [Hyphomicrobiales bacterium]